MQGYWKAPNHFYYHWANQITRFYHHLIRALSGAEPNTSHIRSSMIYLPTFRSAISVAKCTLFVYLDSIKTVCVYMCMYTSEWSLMCYTVKGVRKPMKERLRGTKQLPVKHPLRGFIAESVTRSGVEPKACTTGIFRKLQFQVHKNLTNSWQNGWSMLVYMRICALGEREKQK